MSVSPYRNAWWIYHYRLRSSDLAMIRSLFLGVPQKMTANQEIKSE
jgi:hypothetical protein